MRCIFMSKTNKNILKRVLSKIGNLFKQSEKNSSLEENRKHEEAERSSTITPLKNSKSEDKVFPEKYNKSEDFARDKVNDETKNNTQEYLNAVESQMIDSSDSVPENNTNNLEIHNIVKQDELLNFEVENISPSKNKQESTQVNSSHKDISETHTLIDPKEYLELEYKIIENRKAKTKPVQKNTKDTLPEDKKPFNLEIHNIVKQDELLNFEVENISPSKNKQESTQVNSSHKDISETHTLIDPKEYLELEYKIIENRKAKTKPVQKNTKDTLPEDKKPLDFKLVKQAKEPLENKEKEIKKYKKKDKRDYKRK